VNPTPRLGLVAGADDAADDRATARALALPMARARATRRDALCRVDTPAREPTRTDDDGMTTLARATTTTTTTTTRVDARRRTRARRVVARAGRSMVDERDETIATAKSRRAAVLSVGAALLAMPVAVNTPRARAVVAPEFVEETMEVIDMTRALLRGEKTDEAFIDEFQTKRRAWFAKYQYHHGKSFYGYANAWNAQAKVGVQIAVNRENGVPYDSEHTAYNKDYLLSILDKAEAELFDMQKRNGF
jgi:hypothetical protein